MASRVPNPLKVPVSATPVKLSLAERKAQKGNAEPPRLVEGGHLMRDIDRPPPGDVTRRGSKSRPKLDLAKKRSNVDFFEDAFAVSENSAAKERIRGDAIVMAEVKTNVIISDEFSFITELSYHLSTRYQRPVSSIVVTLHHGACMFFGGSFDAAYVMSIFALPSHLLPTTNRRNAALIQKHMEEALGVIPSRGLLRFVPTSEEHMASNGKTMAGQIDELERSYCSPVGAAAENDASGDAPKRTKTRKKLSVKSFANFRPPSGIEVPTAELTPPASADEALPTIPASPTLPKAVLAAPEKAAAQQSTVYKTATRKKSFVATFFGRSGGKSEYNPVLRAIPSERN